MRNADLQVQHPLDVLVAAAGSRSHEVTAAARLAGLDVEEVADGRAAERVALACRPDVALIDLGLADPDGFALVPRLRDGAGGTVVLALGPDDDHRRVRALEHGFDGYVADTTHPGAVAAEIGAALRLRRRLADPPPEDRFDDGLVRIDGRLRRVEVAGREVTLTPLEFRLLTTLVRHRDRVLSREELQQKTWRGAAPPGGDHVKLYVHYLRRKLHEHTNVELIQTVRGFGYRWLGAEALERPSAEAG